MDYEQKYKETLEKARKKIESHIRVNIQTIALQASKTPQIKRLTLSVVSCKGKTF